MRNWFNIAKDFVYKYLVDHYPKMIINRNWIKDYGYKPNWNNPRDLNEKIQWLICYGDTSKWATLADKYCVREYVKDKGFESLLPKLYGVYTDARDIDFNVLPNKFVLKCNHDSGSTIIVNKDTLNNKEDIVTRLNQNLKNKFGYKYCEPHYNKICPLIIAEEYFAPTESSLSLSLIDYKIWCFHGKAYSVFVCHNRTKECLDIDLFDLEWNERKDALCFNEHFRNSSCILPRPENFSEMISIANKLSEGLPEARIDLYNINGRIVFGEITLTSNYGRMKYFTEEYLIELGNQIHLPK